MQKSAPELMDLGQEPQHILDLYGAKPGGAIFRQQLPPRTKAWWSEGVRLCPALPPDGLGPARLGLRSEA